MFVGPVGGVVSTATQSFNAITASGDDESVTLEGFVYSSQYDGVLMSGANARLVVDGSATAGYDAVALTGSGDTVTVGATGRLTGGFAGLNLYSVSSSSPSAQVLNSGVISGAYGVFAGDSNGSAFNNSGTIQGTLLGLAFIFGPGGNSLVNSGTLTGKTALASRGSATGVTIANSGHIVASGLGVVDLGGVTYKGALYLDNARGADDYISNTGDITAAAGAVAIDSVSDNIIVSNAGRIVGGLHFETYGGAVVTNSGTWDTSGWRLELGVGNGASLTNTGNILGDVFGSSYNTQVVNSGAISGQLNIGSLQGGDVVNNSGTIRAVSLAGTTRLETLVNSAPGVITGDVALSGSGGYLTNAGRIGGNATLSAGRAVNTGEIDGAMTFTSGALATLINRGAIAQGVFINNSTGATLGNAATGAISADPTSGVAVAMLAGDDVLTNAGTVQGDVQLGALTTLRNSGAINGDVAQTSGTAINAGAIQGKLSSGAASAVNGGAIGGGVQMTASGATLTNTTRGDIGVDSNGSAVTFQSYGTLRNAGAIEGFVQFATASGALYNSGQIVGGVAGAVSISNSGALNGGLALGAGAQLTNAAKGVIANGVNAAGTSATHVTLNNAGTISGGFFAYSGDDSLFNSGTLTEGVQFHTSFGPGSTPGHDVVTNGVRGVITGGILVYADDQISNYGVIEGGISTNLGGDVIKNWGTISGTLLIGGYYADTFINYRMINGNVTFNTHLSGVFSNYGVVGGAVTVGAGDSLADLGQIQGDLTLGADDSVTLGRSSVLGTIHAAAGDTIGFSGLSGVATVAGFDTTSDLIGFSTTIFSNFAAVQHAMTQVGADVHITRDAADGITLKGVSLALLSASNFTFR